MANLISHVLTTKVGSPAHTSVEWLVNQSKSGAVSGLINAGTSNWRGGMAEDHEREIRELFASLKRMGDEIAQIHTLDLELLTELEKLKTENIALRNQVGKLTRFEQIAIACLGQLPLRRDYSSAEEYSQALEEHSQAAMAMAGKLITHFQEVQNGAFCMEE